MEIIRFEVLRGLNLVVTPDNSEFWLVGKHSTTLFASAGWDGLEIFPKAKKKADGEQLEAIAAAEKTAGELLRRNGSNRAAALKALDSIRLYMLWRLVELSQEDDGWE